MGRKKKTAAARARLAAAAQAAGLPALAQTGLREPSGRRSRQERPTADQNANREGLKARARQMGWLSGTENPEDKEDQKKIARACSRARAQSLEGQAGRAITAGCTDKAERDRLWETWADFSAARLAWNRRILGASPFAAMPRAPVTERFTITADEAPDLRTPEEKDKDAARRWDWWLRRLGRIEVRHRYALIEAVADATPFLHDGRLTEAGRAFLDALRRIARRED